MSSEIIMGRHNKNYFIVLNPSHLRLIHILAVFSIIIYESFIIASLSGEFLLLSDSNNIICRRTNGERFGEIFNVYQPLSGIALRPKLNYSLHIHQKRAEAGEKVIWREKTIYNK